MADTTYKQAQTANELVPGTPGANQEQITGAEVVGATSATNVDSGWTFTNLKLWTQLDSRFMDKTLYDSNDDGTVDSAAELKAGGQTVTTSEVRTHLDDTSIHFVINDTATTTTVAWSGSKINTEFGGKVSTGQNVGTGQGNVFRDKTGTTLNLKTIAQGGNITVTDNANDITVSTTAELNDGANVGVGNAAIFRDKTGTTLNFKRLVQGANITLTDGADTVTIAATGSTTDLTDAEFPTYAVFDELVSGAAAIDFASGNKQTVDAFINNAVTVTAPAGKPANYMLRILNSGSLTSIAPASGGSILWAGGTAPSWAGRSDLALFYDGTFWTGSAEVNVS